MYQRILVAVDGSPTSDLGIREASMLGASHKAALRLVHIIDQQPAFGLVTPRNIAAYQSGLRQAGERVLSDAMAAVCKSGLQPETKLVVLDGPQQHIYEAIAKEGDLWPADLIVIGTHGRRGFRRLILGSVAEGLIRVATKPVLLVRGE
jgi:nucleotide-binding universal stress UspA family protein